MKIEGYDVTVVRVSRLCWSVSILSPDEISFGIYLMSSLPITEEAAYNYFKKVPENFFIDVECIVEQKLLT